MPAEKEIKTAIQCCLKGDHRAFATLFDYYADMVYRLALKILGSELEAEDMVQESFISAWKKLPGFDTSLPFSAWLYRITVNKCYDELRRRKRQRRWLRDEGSVPEGIELDNPEEKLSREESMQLIRSLSEGLTPKQSVAFVLVDLEEFSHDQAVEISGFNKDQLKSNLYLARKTISEKLNKIAQHECRKNI